MGRNAARARRGGSAGGDLIEMITEFNLAWKRQRPTSATLLGAEALGFSEDLSASGISRWKEMLASFESRIDSMGRTALGKLDAAVLHELARFFKEQAFRDSFELAFDKRVWPYLRLAFLSLLPFQAISQTRGPLNDEEYRFFVWRLKRVGDWLTLCRNRVNSGLLDFTITDSTVSGELFTLFTRWDVSSEKAAERTLDSLHDLSRIRVRKRHYRANPVSIDWYLRTIVGTSYSAVALHSQVVRRLKIEIGKLGDSIDSSKPHQIPHDSSGIPETVECYLRKVHEKLQESDVSLLDKPLVKMKVCPMDIQSEKFLGDAFYLPSFSSEPAEAVLCLSTFYTNSDLDWLLRRKLALVMAHEICPGHAEQLYRAKLSPLSPLFEITRSPTGAEGWGAFAESRIAKLSGYVQNPHYTILFHRVRRLSAVVWAMERAMPELARGPANLKDLLAPLNSADRLQLMGIIEDGGSKNLQLVSYVAGLLETEDALRAIASSLGKKNIDSETVEKYLEYGPLAPSRVASLFIP